MLLLLLLGASSPRRAVGARARLAQLSQSATRHDPAVVTRSFCEDVLRGLLRVPWPAGNFVLDTPVRNYPGFEFVGVRSMAVLAAGH